MHARNRRRLIPRAHACSLDTDLTRNTRAPHFTPQHWLLCHMGLYKKTVGVSYLAPFDIIFSLDTTAVLTQIRSA